MDFRLTWSNGTLVVRDRSAEEAMVLAIMVLVTTIMVLLCVGYQQYTQCINKTNPQIILYHIFSIQVKNRTLRQILELLYTFMTCSFVSWRISPKVAMAYVALSCNLTAFCDKLFDEEFISNESIEEWSSIEKKAVVSKGWRKSLTNLQSEDEMRAPKK